MMNSEIYSFRAPYPMFAIALNFVPGPDGNWNAGDFVRAFINKTAYVLIFTSRERIMKAISDANNPPGTHVVESATPAEFVGLLDRALNLKHSHVAFDATSAKGLPMTLKIDNLIAVIQSQPTGPVSPNEKLSVRFYIAGTSKSPEPAEATAATEPETIAFDFVGGPYDGQVLNNSSSDEMMRGAVIGWYRITRGIVGRQLYVSVINMSDTGQVMSIGDVRHAYELVDRTDVNDSVTIKARYMGLCKLE